MPQPTFWTNWPLSLRQSPPGGPASEMNEAFFEDFQRRDENLRSRVCPGDDLSAQVAFPTLGVWVPIGATSRIWIPPWAAKLVVRCRMEIVSVIPPDWTAYGYARPKLGTVYGSEMRLILQCFFLSGGSGEMVCLARASEPDGALITGPLFARESVIEIPTSMRDTEQAFTYEVKRNNADPPYVRVFNDARDAENGALHRHWYFVEAT